MPSILGIDMAGSVAALGANVTGFAVGGKGYVTLTGDVGAVRAAVAAGCEEGGKSGLLVGSTVIPKYAQQLYDSLL